MAIYGVKTNIPHLGAVLTSLCSPCSGRGRDCVSARTWPDVRFMVVAGLTLHTPPVEASVFIAKVFSKLDMISLPGQDRDPQYVTGPIMFYKEGWKMKSKRL